MLCDNNTANLSGMERSFFQQMKTGSTYIFNGESKFNYLKVLLFDYFS